MKQTFSGILGGALAVMAFLWVNGAIWSVPTTASAASLAAPVAVGVTPTPVVEQELPWGTASISTDTLNWAEVMVAAPTLVNFVPGGPNGNPGPLIEWLDTRMGSVKIEHTTTDPWTITGPALVWGGFHDAPSSYEIMTTAGIKVISAQGSAYRIGTSILVVPAGTTITVYNTGAMVKLNGYDGKFPAAGPMQMQDESVSFPLKCAVASNYPPRIIDLDALAESNPEMKTAARSHFNVEYTLVTPAESGFVLWTTGVVSGATFIGVDPGVGKIYFAYPNSTVTVMGSYQGVAVCAPESAPMDHEDESAPTDNASMAVQIPVNEVASLLNSGADLSSLAEKYPNAVITGSFADQATASILLLGKSDTTSWMTVGEGGSAPSVNLIPDGTIPSGMTAMLLDAPMDPECMLNYWMDSKPARCS